jgi:hypothetical protein
MKTFEYTSITLRHQLSAADKVEKMRGMGDKGYELVAVIPDAYGDHLEFFFKREHDDSTESAKEQIGKSIEALQGALGGFGKGMAQNMQGFGG